MKNILRLFLVVIFTRFIIAQTPNFEGIIYSGEVPPDPVIAVSNDYIVQAVNKKVAVFNKTGTKLFEQSFSDFFANQSPPASIFDPKVAYDQYSDKFILLAAGMNTDYSNSNYMFAVTQGSDPTGAWYKYKLNAVDQNFPQYNIDYPGLGYDEEAIYLTSHQIYNVGGSTSHYPKITILKKSEVYSNTISYRKDFIDFSSGGSYPAKLKPMRKFGSSSGYFLVNTESAKQIRIWKIENPLGGSNATLSAVSTITLDNTYSSISEAMQKGTTYTVDIGDYSISDVVCKDGYLYGTYTAQNTTSNGSMIVYFKVNTSNNYNLDINGKIETENKYYYYPVIHPDNDGNIVFVFNKSSNDDYIGVAWTLRYASNPNIEPIQWLKQGSTWYYHLLNNKNRWGDYCGIALDPNNGYRVWICGEWAYSNDQWSTWIGKISTAGTTNFTFTNTIYDEDTGILNANAGGTVTVSSFPDPVNSGGTLPLELGEPYNEKTDNERFPNWNSLGYTYKHNQWNNELDRKFLSNDFDALLSAIDQKAFFKSLNYAKIEARLEGFLVDQKGYFEFQDPWFIKSDGTQPGNYWRPCYSYYEPTGKEGAIEKGVFLNQPIVSGQSYYKVNLLQPIQDIYLPQTNKTHRFYFQGWNYDPNKISLQYPTSIQTGVVFKESDAVLTANLKGTQLSNSQSAYTNGSQRKIVRVVKYGAPTTLQAVYESNGYCWYEMSSDNGQTWEIMNGGQPLNFVGYNDKGKCPSIEYSPSQDVIYILWQGKRSTPPISSKIMFASFMPSSSSSIDYELQHVELIAPELNYNYEDFDANPILAMGPGASGLIIWKGTYNDNTLNLKYILGWITTGIEFPTYGFIPETDANSSNPSIYGNKSYGIGNIFHLAYQKSFEIYYRKITLNGSQVDFNPQDFIKLSLDNGFSKNYNPSVTGSNENNTSYPKVSWIAYRKSYIPDNPQGGGQQPLGETKVFFRNKNATGWSASNSYGANINSVNINCNSNNTFAFAWSEAVTSNTNVNKFVRNDNLDEINTTNTSGKYLQVVNYDNLNNMRLNSFTTATTPYSFSLSNTFYVIPHFIKYYLDGNIVQDTTTFYFRLGDIMVGGEPVKFEELPDGLSIPDYETLNSYFISRPFTLTDNIDFIYSVEYGITDSLSAALALQDGRFAHFRVELIEDQTSEVLGTFDDVTYNSDNIILYEKIAYQVNTQGIGERICRLRIVTEDDLGLHYSLNNCYNDGDGLGKLNLVQRTIDGINVIKTYALEQNFPNPFNPATVIKYQIPKDGMVTLKIYDILGAEVATLVNEEKPVGRYEATFDATSLASGVYIYRLNVNDFVSIKKMVLLK